MGARRSTSLFIREGVWQREVPFVPNLLSIFIWRFEFLVDYWDFLAGSGCCKGKSDHCCHDLLRLSPMIRGFMRASVGWPSAESLIDATLHVRGASVGFFKKSWFD